MAAQKPARASPELRMAPLSPRYLGIYTTPRGTAVQNSSLGLNVSFFSRLVAATATFVLIYIHSIACRLEKLTPAVG